MADDRPNGELFEAERDALPHKEPSRITRL